MAKTERRRAPVGLKAAGGKLWREVVTEWDLSLSEALILEQACRELDLIGRMEREMSSAGSLFVKGSQGQDRANPILAELRAHRATFAGLLGKLDLRDEEEREASAGSRSAAAREMAAARWRRTG